jgi:CHAT domain-containing protein/tetratricopeptide (TPR) repeat protein
MPASHRSLQRGLVFLLGLPPALASAFLPASLPAALADSHSLSDPSPGAPSPSVPQAITLADLSAQIPASLSPAASLDQRARAAYGAEDGALAASLWQQATEAARSSGDTLLQARMLSNFALAQLLQGQTADAQRSLEAGFALLDTPGLPSGSLQLRTRAQLLHSKARLQFERGQMLAALTTWRQAEPMYRQLGASDAELACRINQAEALQSLGSLSEARDLLESLRKRPEISRQPRLEAAVLASLAAILQRQGENTRAQDLRQRGLSVARASGDSLASQQAYLGLANSFASQRDTAGAVRALQEVPATPGFGSLQADASRLAVQIDDQTYSAAARLWPSLVAKLETLPSNAAALDLRLNLASSLLRLRQAGSGNPAAQIPSETVLRQLLQRSQADADRLGDGRASSRAIGELGALAESAGRLNEAETLSQQALRQAMALKTPELSSRWLWQLGRIFRRQGNRPAALAAYQQALNELSALRDDMASSSPAVASSFRGSVEPISRQFINLLTDSASPTPDDLNRARLVMEELQVAELNDFFRLPCFQSSSIDRLNDPTVAVVYPILLPDRLDVIVRLPGATDPLHHSQPLDTSSLKRTIAELQRQLRKPPDLSARTDSTSLLLPHAKQLHQWLLAPLEPSLQARGITLLVFVPDSALRNLPMAVLHDGKRFLGDRYAIAVAPGMVLTPSIRKPGSKPRVLGAGVSKSSQVSSLPEGSNFFPALPAVEQELTALRRRTGATLLLNERFTSPALQLALQSGDYSVVHLATHGQFSSKPNTTFLMAGQNERVPVDQLATLLQPSQRRTGNSLDLLILSACEGALGDDNANLGLAAVAARSGASSTLASLWSVNDEATAKLMDAFYRHWLQAGSNGQSISKAEALRRAQADLRHVPETNHPYYWGAFTLLGNWR